MRSGQEFIHWLEVGAGSRWIRRAAVVVCTVALSLWISHKQFHGLLTENTLVQADVARQLASGGGFTSLVNYPQTAAFLEARGHDFDPAQPYPELYQAPLYSLTLAAGLKLIPRDRREAWLDSPPAPPDGYAGDYLVLAVNLGLLWLAAWLTFLLGRRLFEPRVGWLASLALLLSVSVWQQTVAANGTPLLMVLVLAAFWFWHRAETAMRPLGWLLGLGATGGALFLAEYSAGALGLVALGYSLVRHAGAQRWLAAGAVAVGFTVVAGPWVARNLSLTGHPVALAQQNVAFKAGDPTAEPATFRATLSARPPALELRKLGNKTLTALQENVKSRIWSGGAMWFAAFFVAGWLYPFREPAANRLRWIAALTVGVLLVAQAAFNSGESDRLAAVWLSPLLLIFGAGFFFVLLASNARLGQWPRLAAFALLALQALPLAHEVLEPRRLHFNYPPYWPPLLRGLRIELERRGALERFGIMADVPAGVAWYGRARAWQQPPRLRDFYAITLKQQIGELLLTPRTLDRPFLSELAARPVAPRLLADVPSATPDRFGEWGEVYAGLLTGTLPREFPLNASRPLAENLYVLFNPTLPPPRGN